MTHKEKNVEVTTDKGETAKCAFTILYTADPFTVNKKKSKAVCKPKVTGIAATVLDLPEVGDVDFEFKLKNGKGKPTKAELGMLKLKLDNTITNDTVFLRAFPMISQMCHKNVRL